MLEIFVDPNGDLTAASGFFIGSTLSFLGVLISVYISFQLSRRQTHSQRVEKISEFSKERIDLLRDDLAALNALGLTPGQRPDLNSEFYRIGTRIELLMNFEDEDYERLVDLMYKYLDAAEGDKEAKYGINANFVLTSQRILKREWERLEADLRNQRI